MNKITPKAVSGPRSPLALLFFVAVAVAGVVAGAVCVSGTNTAAAAHAASPSAPDTTNGAAKPDMS